MKKFKIVIKGVFFSFLGGLLGALLFGVVVALKGCHLSYLYDVIFTALLYGTAISGGLWFTCRLIEKIKVKIMKEPDDQKYHSREPLGK